MQHYIRTAINYYDNNNTWKKKYNITNSENLYSTWQKGNDLNPWKVKIYGNDINPLNQNINEISGNFEVIAYHYIYENIWCWSWVIPFLTKSLTNISRDLLKYGIDTSIQQEEKNLQNNKHSTYEDYDSNFLLIKSLLINSRIKINDTDIDLLILKSITLYFTHKKYMLTIPLWEGFLFNNHSEIENNSSKVINYYFKNIKDKNNNNVNVDTKKIKVFKNKYNKYEFYKFINNKMVLQGNELPDNNNNNEFIFIKLSYDNEDLYFLNKKRIRDQIIVLTKIL